MAKLPEITKFDPELTEKVMGILRPLLKVYHRSEVRGLENIPLGGALVVSNHSGGMLPMDVPIFSSHLGLLHDQVTVSVTRPDWPVWS